MNAVINGPTHTAVNGDTVLLPAGSCTWTSGITIPEGIGITIQGSGTPDSSPGTTGASASCSQTSLTINTDLAATFIATPTAGSATLRLSCLAENLMSGTGARGFSIQGACNSSICPDIRMYNLTFNNWAGHADAGISYGIGVVGDVFGVIDHNTINGNTGSQANYLQLVELNHASFQGIGSWGDNSWQQPEMYGTNNFVFIENNSFVGAGCCENEGNAGELSARGGNRVVVRFNTFNIADQYNFTMGWHGTESSGRARGGRAFEYYGNTLIHPASCVPAGNCSAMIALRSGTGLAWGNTIDSASSNYSGGVIGLNFLRSYATIGGWPACDGTVAEDGNDPAGPQFTGTVASFTGGVLTVSGASPGWTTNQWVPVGAPYSVHDVTISTAKALSVGFEILGNGADTITVDSGAAFFDAPAPGDTIQITRAFWCMDQSGGRGAGALLPSSQSLPSSPPMPPSNEALSPAYFWMNSFTNSVVGGGQSGVGSDTARVIRNRDYYVENTNQAAQSSVTTPFDGTTTSGGIGHGTLANRPTTCVPHVGYWATDQGHWNDCGNGSQGELFLCTAPNTWTLDYTPYTYPHPLVSGTVCDGGQGDASVGGDGGAGGGDDGGFGGGGPAGPEAGVGDRGDGGQNGDSSTGGSGGCGCHTARDRGWPFGALWGIGMAALLATRRRRRSSRVTASRCHTSLSRFVLR